MRRTTAIHEAGHAITYWEAGGFMEYVTILPFPDMAGHFRPAAGCRGICTEDVRAFVRSDNDAELLLHVGGDAAVRAFEHLLPAQKEHRAAFAGSPDERHALACARRNSPGAQAHAVTVAMEFAIRLFLEPSRFATLVGLADELLREKTLTDAMVSAYLTRQQQHWVGKGCPHQVKQHHPGSTPPLRASQSAGQSAGNVVPRSVRLRQHPTHLPLRFHGILPTPPDCTR